MKINKGTYRAIFEALLVAVKEVLLKPYLTNFAAFIKLADISKVITLRKHVHCKYFIYLISISKYNIERHLEVRSMRFNDHNKCSGFSQLRRHFVYKMNDAPVVSHVTHAPTCLSG